MRARQLFPRRRRGITIKMIIVLEVASRARSESARREGRGEKRGGKQDERKGNDMPFSAGRAVVRERASVGAYRGRECE